MGGPDWNRCIRPLGWVKSRKPKELTLVMKSTVPPGSGAAFVRQDLKGVDAEYVANPEFLREGRALQDWMFPDRIVLGAEPDSARGIAAVKKMYSGMESPLLVTGITSAEMIKYASNAFLATRISFINEIASLCDAVGASIDAVSDGLALDGRKRQENLCRGRLRRLVLSQGHPGAGAAGGCRRTRTGPAEGGGRGKPPAAGTAVAPASRAVRRERGRAGGGCPGVGLQTRNRRRPVRRVPGRCQHAGRTRRENPRL